MNKTAAKTRFGTNDSSKIVLLAAWLAVLATSGNLASRRLAHIESRILALLAHDQ